MLVGRIRPASFPIVFGDFECDVTCQACRKNSLALGSKPPPPTPIAQTGLGTRMGTKQLNVKHDTKSTELFYLHYKLVALQTLSKKTG